MLFRELNRGKCKTYLIASERTKKAAFVDPLKDKTEESSRDLGHKTIREKGNS